MLKIKLYNPETDKEETFTETFVSARKLRSVIEFGTKAEEGNLSELDQLDELIAVIADLFRDERVNFDSILDGLPANKMNETLEEIMTQVMGGEEEKNGLKETALKAQGAKKK